MVEGNSCFLPPTPDLSSPHARGGERARPGLQAASPSISPERIIAAARRWLGTPYMHQAAVLGAGCDCLGLLRGVWRDLYGGEPELPGSYSPDWAEAGRREALAEAAGRHLLAIPLNEAGGGDVLLFRWRDGLPAKHIAILIGPDHMIHAHDGAGVTEAALVPWWRRRISHAFRFPHSGVTV